MNQLPATDPLRGVQTIGERSGQKQRGDAEAFRKALQQRRQDQDPGGEARAVPKPPKATALQPQRPAGRNTEAGADRHVDVVA